MNMANVKQAVRSAAGAVLGQGSWSAFQPDKGTEEKIHGELGALAEHGADWDRRMGEVDKKAELTLPALSEISDGRLLVIGGTTGGALGVAYKGIDSLLTVTFGNPRFADVKYGTYPIMDKVLDKPAFTDHYGARDVVGKFVRSENHTFTPNVKEVKVGEYQAPPRELSDNDVITRPHLSNPLWEGVKGLGVGTGIGLLAAGITIAVRRITGKPVQPKERVVKDEVQVIGKSAAYGAAVGGGVGLVEGMIEQANSASKTLSWKVPVMTEKVIGQIPKDHVHSIDRVVREAEVGKQDVTVTGPKMEKGLLGLGSEHPAMTTETREIHVDPRFTVLGGLLGGVAVGAVTGAFLGVLYNTIRKLV